MNLVDRLRARLAEWDDANIEGPCQAVVEAIVRDLRALLTDLPARPDEERAAECPCPDPLRAVHAGCPLHGHSPEAFVQPTERAEEESDQPDAITRRLSDAWKRGYEARAGNKPFNSNPWESR